MCNQSTTNVIKISQLVYTCNQSDIYIYIYIYIWLISVIFLTCIQLWLKLVTLITHVLLT
jgi:hypothetical protein